MERTAKQERILWGAWTLAGLVYVLGTLHRYFVGSCSPRTFSPWFGGPGARKGDIYDKPLLYL